MSSAVIKPTCQKRPDNYESGDGSTEPFLFFGYGTELRCVSISTIIHFVFERISG